MKSYIRDGNEVFKPKTVPVPKNRTPEELSTFLMKEKPEYFPNVVIQSLKKDDDLYNLHVVSPTGHYRVIIKDDGNLKIDHLTLMSKEVCYRLDEDRIKSDRDFKKIRLYLRKNLKL